MTKWRRTNDEGNSKPEFRRALCCAMARSSFGFRYSFGFRHLSFGFEKWGSCKASIRFHACIRTTNPTDSTPFRFLRMHRDHEPNDQLCVAYATQSWYWPKSVQGKPPRPGRRPQGATGILPAERDDA